VKTITPSYLKKGDHVIVIAPAGLVDRERIMNASRVLESWGLTVDFGNHVFGQNNGYSGTDEERLLDLQEALDSAKASAIICARGGYGLSRISSKINLDTFLNQPKWVVGFSDITVLHALINKEGVETIHGPVLNSLHLFPVGDSSPEYLRKLLFGETVTYKIPSQALNRIGKARGLLVGGNFSMLYNMRGTPLDMNPEGKILFIEDVGEYLYHLDRMMMNLKNGGVLERISGLICGGFTEMKDQQIPFGKTAVEIILEAVQDYSYPVAFSFPAGHQRPNYSLKMGGEIQLNVSEIETILTFYICSE
jgi:muramoyltetrapeptide carboxypeptidase